MKVHQILEGTNYIYILREAGQTAVVDPTNASPVIEYLDSQRLKLDFILNTHHHHDHVDGNEELKERFGATIVAAAEDTRRIPGFVTKSDVALRHGDKWSLGGSEAAIIENPGHTLGAISFYFAKDRALFSGDTLFSFGCGRLFEGTPEIMMKSLRLLKDLPDETLVYCGHEYAVKNLEFCVSLGIEGAKERLAEAKNRVQNGQFVVPTTLGEEKRLNPFMTTENLEEWTRRRSLRNLF